MKLEHVERKKQVKPDNRIKLHLFCWRVILNVVSGGKARISLAIPVVLNRALTLRSLLPGFVVRPGKLYSGSDQI